MNFFKDIKAYSELIKLGHTLFALPFALSALCLAYIKGFSFGIGTFILVVIAFAAARSAAMGFNRIVDTDIDILNPRTKNRPSVNGRMSKPQMAFFTLISVLIFILSAAAINRLCFILSFPALLVLFGYSYAKRFTYCAHYILGFALSLAPVGAWIAVADSLYPPILLLGAALFFNISAFDLIYSLQDMNFDIAHSLHSIPSRFGKNAAIFMAVLGFLAAIVFFLLTGVLFSLNTAYFLCVVGIGFLYATGIYTVFRYGLARINLVFFYMSVGVSALLLFGVATNIF